MKKSLLLTILALCPIAIMGMGSEDKRKAFMAATDEEEDDELCTIFDHAKQKPCTITHSSENVSGRTSNSSKVMASSQSTLQSSRSSSQPSQAIIPTKLTPSQTTSKTPNSSFNQVEQPYTQPAPKKIRGKKPEITGCQTSNPQQLSQHIVLRHPLSQSSSSGSISITSNSSRSSTTTPRSAFQRSGSSNSSSRNSSTPRTTPIISQFFELAAIAAHT